MNIKYSRHREEPQLEKNRQMFNGTILNQTFHTINGN